LAGGGSAGGGGPGGGKVALYVGAAAEAGRSQDVGHSPVLGRVPGGGSSGSLSLKEYLEARAAFIELQRARPLYDSAAVANAAWRARPVQGEALKQLQEELERWAPRLDLDFNAQLLEVSHAITATRVTDPPPPTSKGEALSALLSVASRSLHVLEELDPAAFRDARRTLLQLRGTLRELYMSECIPY